MRYNEEIYRKVFPEEKEKTVVESAVETFKPTEEEEDIDSPADDQEGEADGRDGELDTE